MFKEAAEEHIMKKCPFETNEDEKVDELINKNNNKKPFEIPHTEAERELNLHNNLVDLGCF